MKRNAYLLIIFLLASLTSFAAGPSASEVLAKTAKKINDASCVTADFAASSGDVKTFGTLKMSKGMFAMVSTEYGIWYDGDDMWSYSQQTGETSLTNPTPDELAESNPFDIINNYAARYNAKMLSSKAGKYEIELTAKSKSASVKKAVLTIDAATMLPTQITATFSNSQSLSIAIASAKLGNAEPAKSDFTFPAKNYPGIEVIDLR